MKGITFTSTINRITTLVDGGWRISFDVPDSESGQVIALAQLRKTLIQVGLVAVKDLSYDKENPTQ